MVLGLIQNTIQLVPDGTIFLHIGLIILMVFVLNITLFRPVNRILEERDRQIRGRSSDADKILARVDANLRLYEQSLREARAEGYRLLEHRRSEAMLERQRLLNALRQELQVSTEEQKQQLQGQVEQAQSVLGAETRQVAVEISRKILRRSVNL